MYNILVVDDEKDIVAALEIYLRSEGYRVLPAYNGKEALSIAAREDVHLILMDIMMPVMDGLTAMAQLRQTSNVPVILLTAKGEDTDKVLGLNVGADDYIPKPFRMMELLSRVRAVLRRTEKQRGYTEYQAGALYVCPSRHVVEVEGKPVTLTLKEFEILCLLLANQGVVMTRSQLLDQIWGYAFDGESRTVDVHIRTLRQKLGPAGEYIETVRGIGYKMRR